VTIVRKSYIEIALSALLISTLSIAPSQAVTTKPKAPAKSIITLVVAPDHLTGYLRTKFKHWIDADHDGCSTRNEVLIAEAIVKPTVGGNCALYGGRWVSPYDGVAYTDPGDLDIDHLVPLSEAWRSGAWKWTALLRQNYANDLTDPRALVAVTASANRQKGDQDPSTWMPELDQCGYISNWIAIKAKYSLTVDNVEANALAKYVASCGLTNIKFSGIKSAGAALHIAQSAGYYPVAVGERLVIEVCVPKSTKAPLLIQVNGRSNKWVTILSLYKIPSKQLDCNKGEVKVSAPWIAVGMGGSLRAYQPKSKKEFLTWPDGIDVQ
jgi:hypothetical protein